MRTNILARSVLAATGLAAAISLTACTGSFTASGTASDSTATAKAPAAAADKATATTTLPPAAGAAPGLSTGTAQAPAAATKTGLTPECKAANLKLTFGESDGAAGTDSQVLRFTNTGTASCVMVGFPGVSYVGNNNGTQIGAPAKREGSIGAQFTLRPGQVASTVITTSDGDLTLNQCHPVAIDGYRIYPPDDTASLFIRLPGGNQGCSSPSVVQMSVVSLHAGPGNPDE